MTVLCVFWFRHQLSLKVMLIPAGDSSTPGGFGHTETGLEQLVAQGGLAGNSDHGTHNAA